MQHPETPEEAIAQAVEDGAALVEREYGADWFRRIDLRRLDLASGNYCILGQLEGRAVAIESEEQRAEEDPSYTPDVTAETPPSEIPFYLYNGYDRASERLGLWEYADEDETVNVEVVYGFQGGYLPYDGLDERGRQRRADVRYEALQTAWEDKIRSLLAGGHAEV